MSYTAIIVESPGKIKNFSKYLGNGYNICASVGHILDLDENDFSIDVDNNYEPTYIIKKDHNDAIKNIKKICSNAKEIYLAGDKDREGQMINWSLAHILEIKNPKRIIFTSTTKKDIINAVDNPLPLDYNIINSQKTRRILDRIIGYKLSNPISKKLLTGVAVGRVLSVVVKLIIDRDNEIKNKLENVNSFFKFIADFSILKNCVLHTIKPKQILKIYDNNEAKKIFDEIQTCTFVIKDITDSEHFNNPSAPFTTSSLLQEAKRSLGFTAERTMRSAQHLYENGNITYMRSDSVELSSEALDSIKNYILKKYGNNYYKFRTYHSKNGNTQEAHEAIRITQPCDETIELSENNKIGNDEKKLYEIIWKRTIACQMTPIKYILKKTIITFGEKNKDLCFVHEQKQHIFDGYNILYFKDKLSENLCDIKINMILKIENLNCTEEYENIPSHYDEASLINKLDPDNLNIGRPSTYVKLIKKMIDNKYVIKTSTEGVTKMLKSYNSNTTTEVIKQVQLGKETDKYVPTTLGNIVTKVMTEHFPNIMNYEFTATMEKELDDIANGNINWFDVVDKFYKMFIDQFNIFLNISDKTNFTDKSLGNGMYITLINKKSTVKQIINDKTIYYADIEKPYTYDNITYEEALKLIEDRKQYPKKLCIYCDNDVLINKGKFGYYISYNKKNIHIENADITENEALELINNENKKINKCLGKYEKKNVSIKTGGFGPYINYNKKNYSLKNIENIENITLENAIEIILKPKTQKKFKKFAKKK